MNKRKLVEVIAEKANLTLAQAETALTAAFDTIQAVMMEEGEVAIPGFGSFGTKARAARKGRNPRTGEEILIPETIVAVFKPGSQLKQSVNSINTKEE